MRFLDHTADVGIDVEASTLAGLFHNAATGLVMLLRGEDDEPESEPALESKSEWGREIGIELTADDRAGLLAGWLRELVFLHEARGLDYAGARFDRLDDAELSARVGVEPARRAVREIKGVTLHGLEAEETPDGWRARVIFDV